MRFDRDVERPKQGPQVSGSAFVRQGRLAAAALQEDILRSEAGQVIPVASATVTSETLKKTGNLLRVEPQLPLGELPPGRYVFSLEAKSTAGGDIVSRSIPFRMR